MTLQRNHIVLAAAACGAAALATPASAQTKWNEIPAPAGKEALARTYPAGYRTDVIDVPIRGNDGDLEYKIQMKAGSTVVYSWEVRNLAKPEEFYTEFHGHTEPVGGRGDLMFYEKSTGAKASGALVAPWEGIHGWYWQNQSAAPVVVRLRLAGFYELVPGQAGRPVQE
jgi:hypothetical protein